MGEPTKMSESDRQQLDRVVREQGARKAAAVLGVSVPTLARAIAGMGVQRVTVAALRGRLLELPRAQP